MKQELTIESAPREIPALMALQTEQRLRLFKRLCGEMGRELPPGMDHFIRLSDGEQAIVLAHFLTSYDTACGTVMCIPVATPIRSKTHSVNVRRMEHFAKEVQEAINTVRRTGSKLELVILQGQGMLVLGEKGRQMVVQPVVIAGVPPVSGGPGGGSDPIARSRVSGVLDKLQQHSLAPEGLTDATANKLVLEELKGMSPKDLIDFKSAVEIATKMHHASCHDTECVLSRALSVVHKTVEDLLRVAVN